MPDKNNMSKNDELDFIEEQSLALLFKNKTTKWLFIALITQITVIVILNSFIHGPIADDYYYYIQHLHTITNPYDPPSYYNKYPPFYFIFMDIIHWIGVEDITGIKFAIGVFDIGNVIFIVKIAQIYKGNKSDAWVLLPAIIYIYFPQHIWVLSFGENDPVALFFLLAAFFYFLKKKFSISSIFLGLGITFKVFPIFFLIPASLYFLKTKQIKKGITYWLIIGVEFLVVSLPFLTQNPIAFFEGIFLHSSRLPTGFTYASAFQFLYNPPILSIWFLDISLNFLLHILLLALVFIFGYLKIARMGRNELLTTTFWIFFLVNIISINDHPIVVLRYLPFISLLLADEVQYTTESIKYLLFGAFGVIFPIFLYYIFSNQENLGFWGLSPTAFLLVLVYWISNEKEKQKLKYFSIFLLEIVLILLALNPDPKFVIFYFIFSTKFPIIIGLGFVIRYYLKREISDIYPILIFLFGQIFILAYESFPYSPTTQVYFNFLFRILILGGIAIIEKRLRSRLEPYISESLEPLTKRWDNNLDKAMKISQIERVQKENPDIFQKYLDEILKIERNSEMLEYIRDIAQEMKK